MTPLFSFLKSKPKAKRWIHRNEDLPWFDQAGAACGLEDFARKHNCPPEEKDILRQWIDDGYVVIRDLVSPADIDQMMKDLDEIWTTEKPIQHLQVLGARLSESEPLAINHEELVRLDPERKNELRAKTPWRVHNFFEFSAAARRIHENAELVRWNSLLFGKPARARATINFAFGSRQALHQDMTVFLIHPRNYLIGAWLACEDISPESGPLVYYPGSHKAPMFEGFDNYPQTCLKTCDTRTRAAYEAWLEETARSYERHQYLGKKGEVLLWHGMLIHGGDKVIDPLKTRRSYVCHYIPEGVERDKEVVGPFNW